MTPERIVKMLLAIGILVLVLGVAAGGTAVWKIAAWMANAPTPASTIQKGSLGKEGVQCGGKERLPCEPGFVCDSDDEEAYGACVKDERETFPAGKEGEVCGDGIGCVPGLVCNAVGRANGVCISPEKK